MTTGKAANVNATKTRSNERRGEIRNIDDYLRESQYAVLPTPGRASVRAIPRPRSGNSEILSSICPFVNPQDFSHPDAETQRRRFHLRLRSSFHLRLRK